MLNALDLPYCVVGGIALSFYNYNRATTDIDILIEANSLDYLKRRLSSVGVKQIHGRRFKLLSFDYEIEFILAGEQLNPNDIIYPSPESVRIWNNHEKCWVIDFKSLVMVKLYGYTYNKKRIKDLADVQELLLANLERKKEVIGWTFKDSLVNENWKAVIERTYL